tara:strand:+ start:1193 stop:1522 length:330 start_codon:yes stop_codon:yes gene_type:complete
LALFFVHKTVDILFFNSDYSIPLWIIYIFNAFLVFLTYALVASFDSSKFNNLNIFIFATINKMLITVIFLLINIQSLENKIDFILSFFGIYFLFLIFEIFSIKVFLNKH